MKKSNAEKILAIFALIFVANIVLLSISFVMSRVVSRAYAQLVLRTFLFCIGSMCTYSIIFCFWSKKGSFLFYIHVCWRFVSLSAVTVAMVVHFVYDWRFMTMIMKFVEYINLTRAHLTMRYIALFFFLLLLLFLLFGNVHCNCKRWFDQNQVKKKIHPKLRRVMLLLVSVHEKFMLQILSNQSANQCWQELTVASWK